MTDVADAPASQEEELAPEPGGARPFIEPVAMEEDPDELFAGDRGVLDSGVRRVLVRLLQRRFLLADRHKDDWAVLVEHQPIVESRLNDLFVRLVVDHDRGVAYKQQVRSDELDVPILLRDDAYTRAETLVLVHLRTLYQREATAGQAAARVDAEEVEQTVLTYFAESDGDTARRQRAVRAALARLRAEGVIEEESEGRYRISPLVEIVLSAQRLAELVAWLRSNTVAGAEDEPGDEAEAADDEHADEAPPGFDQAEGASATARTSDAEEPDSDAEESDDRAPGAFDVALPLGEDDAGTDTEHDPAGEADERQGAES